ncbi:hypothetical protein JOQ06_024067, partial [Pogonophryne albipinna]
RSGFHLEARVIQVQPVSIVDSIDPRSLITEKEKPPAATPPRREMELQAGGLGGHGDSAGKHEPQKHTALRRQAMLSGTVE